MWVELHMNTTSSAHAQTKTFDLQRASGILLHPSSLPSPWGIGDLGPMAYRFVDFLVAAGQSLWQVLPLGPTGYGDSPYQCFSAFAGNPLLISIDDIIEQGLLTVEEARSALGNLPTDHVDYGALIPAKYALLWPSFERFQSGGNSRFRKITISSAKITANGSPTMPCYGDQRVSGEGKLAQLAT